MADVRTQDLRNCLAYTVVCDPAAWLGDPSPSALQLFLAGTALRVSLTGADVSEWRVFGPLDQSAFYLPLVARTGHPTLSIRWSTALELHHFALPDAMAELKTLLEQADPSAFPDLVLPLRRRWPDRSPETLIGLLRRLAGRPAMFLGRASGWGLRSYLAGMDRGGEWLQLPLLPGLRDVVDAIENQSLASYGSPFAGYRVYDDPAQLLAWAGIEPD
jgi:hypothetical protein